MTTTTRTTEEIYEAISAMRLPESPKGATKAEGLAVAEQQLLHYQQREELWTELLRSIPLQAPGWQYAAASGAASYAMEQIFQGQDRVERYKAALKAER